MKLNKLIKNIKFGEIFELYGTDWKNIIKHPNLPEDFIDEYFYYLKPFGLERNQKLTIYLLVKYQKNLNWQIMSKTQDLPEELMEKYKKYLNWNYISEYQNLSIHFLKKYSKYLNWEKLCNNKNLTTQLLFMIKKYYN